MPTDGKPKSDKPPKADAPDGKPKSDKPPKSDAPDVTDAGAADSIKARATAKANRLQAEAEAEMYVYPNEAGHTLVLELDWPDILEDAELKKLPLDKLKKLAKDRSVAQPEIDKATDPTKAALVAQVKKKQDAVLKPFKTDVEAKVKKAVVAAAGVPDASVRILKVYKGSVIVRLAIKAAAEGTAPPLPKDKLEAELGKQKLEGATSGLVLKAMRPYKTPEFFVPSVGQIVFIKGKRYNVDGSGNPGTVRFVGETGLGKGVWVGIELAPCTYGLGGENDGTAADGKRYFGGPEAVGTAAECRPGFGIFVRPSVLLAPDGKTPLGRCGPTAAPSPALVEVLGGLVSELTEKMDRVKHERRKQLDTRYGAYRDHRQRLQAKGRDRFYAHFCSSAAGGRFF